MAIQAHKCWEVIYVSNSYKQVKAGVFFPWSSKYGTFVSVGNLSCVTAFFIIIKKLFHLYFYTMLTWLFHVWQINISCSNRGKHCASGMCLCHRNGWKNNENGVFWCENNSVERRSGAGEMNQALHQSNTVN